MPDPTMTENPFQAIKLALWRKIDDTGAGGGAELLNQWAASENPEGGLTAFRLDDDTDGGFPVEVRSNESPALHIGCRPSQRIVFAPGRSVAFPEQFEVTGFVASRTDAARDKFLWLVLRALWWDYPRLLNDNNVPLPGIEIFNIEDVSKEYPKRSDGNLFWRFTIRITVKFCVHLQTWTVD